jgi:hypothetical protein
MPHLLRHILFSYRAVTLLLPRWPWVDDRYVTLGMAGALAPDVSKAYMVIREDGI